MPGSGQRQLPTRRRQARHRGRQAVELRGCHRIDPAENDVVAGVRAADEPTDTVGGCRQQDIHRISRYNEISVTHVQAHAVLQTPRAHRRRFHPQPTEGGVRARRATGNAVDGDAVGRGVTQPCHLFGAVLADQTNRLTARRCRRCEGGFLTSDRSGKQHRQELSRAVALSHLEKGVRRLLEIVEGVNGVRLAEGAPCPCRQIGEQLCVRPRPPRQRTISCITAATRAPTVAMQTPLVDAPMVGGRLVGDDKIFTVREQHATPQTGIEICRTHLGIVTGCMGQRLFDVGIFPTIDGGTGDAIQWRSLSVDHDEAVGITPVHLVMIGEVDIPAVDGEHLTVGVQDKTRFIRVFVAEALFAYPTVFPAQQQIGGVRAPIGAKYGIAGSGHEDRRPPCRLLRGQRIIVEEDGIWLVETTNVGTVLVIQPVPMVHGAVRIHPGQIVAVCVIQVSIIGIRPTTIRQADVHRPIMGAIQQWVSEQIDGG